MRQQHQQIQEHPRPEDALDERGSYDNNPGDNNPADDNPADDNPVGSASVGTDGYSPTDDTRDTADRGDLADASHTDVTDTDGSDDRGVTAERSDGFGSAGGDWTDRDGVPARDGGARRVDGAERPEFHEPAPLPTAFGATSVGGAVASSALAGDRRDPREDELARSGDGVAEDRIDGIDDNSAPGATDTDVDRDSTDADRTSTAVPTAGDMTADGYPADADATATGSYPADASGSYPVTADDTTGDGQPTAVASASSDDRTTTAEGQAAAAAFLEPATVTGFRDRWREVQLRFVDDPSGAAADAQRLVEESIEALTTALAEQRAELGRWQGDGASDGAADTEQLRMAVRRHREFLDRILGR